MAILGLVAVIVVVVMALTRNAEDPPKIVDSYLPPLQWEPVPTPAAAPPEGEPLNIDRMKGLVQRKADLKFLHARWAAAERERAAGGVKCVPAWFFDEATDAQRKRLRDDGWDDVANTVCKGTASDLIALALPPTADQRAFLRKHHVSTRNMSQSRARYEVADLEDDPERALRLRNP